MKYYSELLDKFFDSEKEALDAEITYKKNQEKINTELKQAVADKEAKDKEMQATKKKLAKEIEQLDQKVTEATNLYEAAREKAQAILDEARKQAKDILDTAREKVREAEEAKYKAVSEFNKQFGSYTVTLTGAKAADAYNRAIQRVTNLWNDFWRF